MAELASAVESAFRDVGNYLRDDLRLMPLSRWNESVFRYQFGRCLATSHGQVEQFFECGKIDLVLRSTAALAFVEFKFYSRPQRHDPYTATPKGYKGGPGPKNLSEFVGCVNTLHRRVSQPSLLKFIVLVFADPTNVKSKNSYAKQYASYRHPDADVPLHLVASFGPFPSEQGLVHGQLFQIRPGS